MKTLENSVGSNNGPNQYTPIKAIYMSVVLVHLDGYYVRHEGSGVVSAMDLCIVNFWLGQCEPHSLYLIQKEIENNTGIPIIKYIYR